MSNLNIKELKVEQARVMNFTNDDITLKRDGTLIYYLDGELESPRCNRSERFKHILDILKSSDIGNCFGEMYIDNGNVFDVSKKENWKKAKFMPIDLIDENNYDERQKILFQKVKSLNNPFITIPIRFMSFDEGWKYVLDNKCEGLVIRNKDNWFKIKLLQEVKVKIKSWEMGKDKGTFVLEDGNRVSGTSMGFVNTFLEIKKQDKTPMMEVEYAFYTMNNRMFQPRCRKVYKSCDVD